MNRANSTININNNVNINNYDAINNAFENKNNTSNEKTFNSKNFLQQLFIFFQSNKIVNDEI